MRRFQVTAIALSGGACREVGDRLCVSFETVRPLDGDPECSGGDSRWRADRDQETRRRNPLRELQLAAPTPSVFDCSAPAPMRY
jgi:hypothetical protein